MIIARQVCKVHLLLSSMCYHTKLTSKIGLIENRLNAKFVEPDTFEPKAEFNGFTAPATPIVRYDDPRNIYLYEWGLIADWVKTAADAKKARMNCLNARIEELKEKPSYRTKINNRCLVAMDGMYEWQWANPKAKQSVKTKYLVTAPDDSVFLCAGLFNEWHNRETGIITYCYTIVTTQANDLMKEIHNNGERMLVVLNNDEHAAWLDPKIDYMAFADRSAVKLKAIPLEPKQTELF